MTDRYGPTRNPSNGFAYGFSVGGVTVTHQIQNRPFGASISLTTGSDNKDYSPGSSTGWEFSTDKGFQPAPGVTLKTTDGNQLDLPLDPGEVIVGGGAKIPGLNAKIFVGIVLPVRSEGPTVDLPITETDE